MSSTSVYFQIQIKVFTRWINTIIQCTNLPPMKDLQEGLSDGVVLCKLLELLSGKAAPRKYTQNIKSRHHKIQNLNIALGFLNIENVRLTGCVPEDFADGNLNKVLSVIWQIILKYQIQSLSLSSDNPKASIKECLLNWVRAQVKDYDIEVKDFLQSWTDGFAFSILAFKFSARTLEAASFKKEHALDNLRFAFAAGEEHFGIVPLLDPEDMLNKYIDELSVMTYVSFYPKAYERAAKAHEILMIKRSNSRMGFDLELTSPKLGSPPLSSPRLSLATLSPVLASPRRSLITSANAPLSPRPSKIPLASLVSLQSPQQAQPKPQNSGPIQVPPPYTSQTPTLSTSSEINLVFTPSSPLLASKIFSPSPSPRRTMSSVPPSLTTSHEYSDLTSLSFREGTAPSSNCSPTPPRTPSPSTTPSPSHTPSPPTSPSPPPQVLRNHQRSPFFGSTDTFLRKSVSKGEDTPSEKRFSFYSTLDTSQMGKFDNSQSGKRTFPNRQATGILAKEALEAVQASKKEEKEPVSGPNMVVREVKEFMKEINLHIEEAKKTKAADNNGKEEKTIESENARAAKGEKEMEREASARMEDSMAKRRSTVSASSFEGERLGSTMKVGWKMGDVLPAREATSSSNNNNNSTTINNNSNNSSTTINNNNHSDNGLRKRAWTRGHLMQSEGELLVVGRRGSTVGHGNGVKIGNSLASNASDEEVADLRKRLALQEHKNEENLILLDEARSKLEKAVGCLHSLLRRTELSPSTSYAKLDTEELHEWQIKREQKLKYQQEAQDENSTLKVAMDMMHEELLYIEHANELLQKQLSETQAQLAECKRSLENANTEKSKDLDVLKYEWKLVNSEKEKLIYLLEKEQYEHKKLQGFYDQDQKTIQDLQKQLAAKAATKEVPKLNFDILKRSTDQNSPNPSPRTQSKKSLVSPNTSVIFETKTLPSHTTPTPDSLKLPITSPRDKLFGSLKGNFSLQKKKQEQQAAREAPKQTEMLKPSTKSNKFKTQMGTVDLGDLDEFITEYSQQNTPAAKEHAWRTEMLRKDSGNLDIHLWNLINGNSRSIRASKLDDVGSDVASSSKGPSNPTSPHSTSSTPGPSQGPSPAGTPISASPATSSNSLSSSIGNNVVSASLSTGKIDGDKSSGEKSASSSFLGSSAMGRPRRNTIGNSSGGNSAEEPVLVRRRSQSFSSSSEDTLGPAPNPELNKIVEQQYDEMNTRLTYLREQIGNLAAKHYGPNALQRKLQSKQSMKRRKPQFFSSLEHVHVESSWKKHSKSFSQLSCVCLIFNQTGQVVHSQNSVSKVQQQLGNSQMLKSKSIMRISPGKHDGSGAKTNEAGFLEGGIRFHTTPTQPVASAQGSFTMDLIIPNLPENGTSILVLITPEDSETFANFSHVSTKVSTIGKPKAEGKNYTEKTWGVWNKLIPEPASSSCESLAVILLSREDPSSKTSKWRLDFLCSEISELNTHELPLDFLQNSMVVKNYLPTKFQLEKCMEELSALQRMDENWDLQAAGQASDEEDGKDDEEDEPLDKDREAIEAKLDEILKEYHIPSAPRWVGGNIFRIGSSLLPLFLINGSLFVHSEDSRQIKFEDWLSKFIKKIVRTEIVRSGTFGN
eukprot:Phypoly_transcript_00373.p1 GENE.Phypoly_transcript_00373~~Phypoly_transcript_00373.p1  ORF type:complete len:1607 (+),score=372.19 Phypoly_transcript_00373:148-4968(+)